MAGHCPGIYFTKGGDTSNLLDCAQVQEDVGKCQDAGVKILLSIGGWYSTEYGDDYSLSSNNTGIEFANFLYGAFGPYDADSDLPRPFDYGSDHNSVDGFDFDIEYNFGMLSFLIMVMYKVLTELQPTKTRGLP